MAEKTNTCRIQEKHGWIECKEAALPGDPDGLCILHSSLKEKDKQAFADALRARIEGKRGPTDFECVYFPTLFAPKLLPGLPYFPKNVDFSWATFSEGADFRANTFSKEASYRNTSIGGRVVFRNNNPPFIANFSDLQFLENGVLRFQDMSLALVRFAGTDLRRPEFHHVTWHRLRGGRQVLYDEVLLKERELALIKRFLRFIRIVSAFPFPPSTNEYAEVERLYRNLQVNYESANDYKSSGNFHYGELEMHRRASKWRWFPLYWYNLYWLSSGYGERPLRALLTLVGLLLALTGVLFLLGGVEEKIADGWNKTGFWQALLYVFQQGTLQKPDWLKPATTGGKFLSALMPVLIPGQAALFFLALRNRLGRRR
jgi:hypothetical protein